MKHDALIGAMYGLVVPFVMPFVAHWTRRVNYWVFFIVGGLSIPFISFLSMGIRQGWNSAMEEVLPRVATAEGILIAIGLGMGTVVLVWIARISGLERTEQEKDTDVQ
ncbi:hypothetical protein [Trinickia sp. EG282A]|uniref:hypothetical protein n=1 Tax=Trinickia sp. EG282A TaxID=3237013 RepID=UPI0034D1AD4C